MKLFSGIGGGIAAILAGLLASAQLADAKTKPAPQAVKCQHCKMALSTKKTTKTQKAVKVNGKTYYCCGGCAMHSHKAKTVKKALDKAAKAKVAVPKAAAVPLCPKCRMQMIASPTLLKKTPIAVNGKTYYCCTICPHH